MPKTYRNTFILVVDTDEPIPVEMEKVGNLTCRKQIPLADILKMQADGKAELELSTDSNAFVGRSNDVHQLMYKNSLKD